MADVLSYYVHYFYVHCYPTLLFEVTKFLSLATPHQMSPLSVFAETKCFVDTFYSGTRPAAPWPAGCDSAISCLWERQPCAGFASSSWKSPGAERGRPDSGGNLQGRVEAVRCWVDLSLSRMYSRSCVLGRICLVRKYLYIRHCIVLAIQR